MVNNISINATETTSNLLENISPILMDKLSPLITILKAIGILVLIYIIFLVIRALLRLRDSSRLKKISKNVAEINDKLDILVRRGKKSESKKIEESKKKEEKQKKKIKKEKGIKSKK